MRAPPVSYIFTMDVTALRGKVAELEAELARKAGPHRRPLPRLFFLPLLVAPFLGLALGRYSKHEAPPVLDAARPAATETLAQCTDHRIALEARVAACHRIEHGWTAE